MRLIIHRYTAASISVMWKFYDTYVLWYCTNKKRKLHIR